jgi:hypothetical protein
MIANHFQRSGVIELGSNIARLVFRPGDSIQFGL